MSEPSESISIFEEEADEGRGGWVEYAVETLPSVARDEGRRRDELEQAAIAWHEVFKEPMDQSFTSQREWDRRYRVRNDADVRLHRAVAALLESDTPGTWGA